MAWYGDDGWAYYPPYVSVAREERARDPGARQAAEEGRSGSPSRSITRRKRQLAATFWGKAWCDNLERYADFANRLPRGRTYLRNGSVLDLAIAGGQVEAYVAGTELYRVTIGIAPLAKARWRRVVTRCTGRIGSLVGLLRGELSAEVLGVLTHAAGRPLPRAARDERSTARARTPREVCKHVAAVLYGVGMRLDARPELFFGCARWTRRSCSARRPPAPCARRRPAAGKRIADDGSSAVFGIELEDAPRHGQAVRHARTRARARRAPA